MSRAKTQFQILRRRAKGAKQLFYVAFRLPDGSLASPRSSGQTSRGGAQTWAIEQIKSGKVPTTKTSRREEIVAFLTDFWDFEHSKYVRGKIARGGTISRGYCYDMGLMINKRIKPYFEGRAIRTFTADDFDEWMADMAADEVSPKAINESRKCVNVAFNYLVSLRRLPWNPLTAVKPYKEVSAKRGTLTPEEYRAVLALDGLDPRVYVAITLGGLCGMRLGEIRGLKWGDVDNKAGLIRIVRSFVEIDGERDQAKQGSNRDALLCTPVAEALEAWRTESPATAPADWVTCNCDSPSVPMRGEEIRQAFYSALDSIKVGAEERQARRIVFHSLRHFFNTQLRGSIPESLLRRLTGHHSEEMTDLYDAGKEIDFQKARARLEEIAAPPTRKAESGK